MKIVIPIYDGVQPLDVTGPMEVFAAAAEILSRRDAPGARPEVRVVGAAPSARSPSGLTLSAEPLGAVTLEEIDTLIVPGGTGVRDGSAIAALAPWLRSVALSARRVTSVCTGAFALAALGLLDGERATTHWAYARSLAQRYPRVTVDDDAIYVRSGRMWTSAGVTAGIDLALALVEDDHGVALAQEVARWLVVPHRRSGGQSQHAAELWLLPSESGPVLRAQEYVRAHLGGDCSVEVLAREVGMSPRNFQRVFRTATGVPPARFVARCRLEEAKRLLQCSDLSLPEVARRAGFGTDESLRRAFVRALGLPPSTWRASARPPSKERS